MSGIFDAVMGSMDQRTIGAIANQLGTSPQQTEGAVQVALPMILAAMSKRASTPQGAQDLHGTLTQSHSALDINSVLGSVLGGGSGAPAGSGGLGGLLGGLLGGGGNDAAPAGGAILGQIFGANHAGASQGLGKATGMDAQTAAQLLAILGPIVMGAIGHHTANNNLDAGGLTSVLGHETQRVRQQGGVGAGVLGAVLDRDGDGDVDLQDLMQAGGGLLGMLNRR